MAAPDLILGAGLSGLTCGYHLPNALVLEKEAGIGGLARTVFFQGYRFDLGGHRLLKTNETVIRFIRETLGVPLAEIERTSIIFKNGAFLNYPPDLDALFRVGVSRSMLWGGSYLFRKLFPLKPLSFKEEVINRFGEAVYQFYFEGYTEKVWGLPCSELSADLAESRIPALSLYRAVRHLVCREQQVRSFADRFLYPAQGIGQICDKLAERVTVRTHSAVTGFEVTGRRIAAVIVNGTERIPCARVISTIPLTLLVKWLPETGSLGEDLRFLRYRSLICVFLTLKKERFTNAHWVYFPGTEIFGRLHEPKNWSARMVPDTERTGLCFEIFCDENDVYWNADDELLCQQVVATMPLIERGMVEQYTVVRVPNAYPLYTKGYRDALSRICQHLERYENLSLLGRTGRYQYSNMDDCVVEAMAVAQRKGIPV